MKNGSMLHKKFDNVEMRKLFSIPKKVAKSAKENNQGVIVGEVYMYIFRVMYLSYINRVITIKLQNQFKDDWKDKNIGFVISTENMVLDKVFDTKENLNELLLASGILHQKSELRKAQIVNSSQGMLPLMETKLAHWNTRIKSYFVIAQIHQTYIQLTLHQVVRISSPQENSATIIVKDEIIQTKDPNDSLYKRIWKHMTDCNQVNYCDLHMMKEDQSYNLDEYKSSEAIWEKMRLEISKIVST